MHVIPPHVPAVSLYSGAKEIRRYLSLSDAINVLGRYWLQANLGPYAQRQAADAYPPREQYTLQDEAQRLIPWDEIEANLVGPSRPGYYRYAGFYPFWTGTGPVPYTGRRSYRGAGYRHPKTQAARREAHRPLDDMEPKVRGKRSASKLPSAWDDVLRSDSGAQSWKRYRATQWRAPRG